MNNGSARHSAEESPSSVTTSRRVFLKPNGVILMRTIVDMAIISNGCANCQAGRVVQGAVPRSAIVIIGGLFWVAFPENEAAEAPRESGLR